MVLIIVRNNNGVTVVNGIQQKVGDCIIFGFCVENCVVKLDVNWFIDLYLTKVVGLLNQLHCPSLFPPVFA
jgi:hypothetical protein